MSDRDSYLEEDSYRLLQNFLIKQPEAGDLIQGTGGLRKIRWLSANKGKRGGIRVIYYYQVRKKHIYFLTVYSKSEMSDLTPKEKQLLKNLIEEQLL